MATDSEYRIYKYVIDVLERLGWDTRNPARGGQVYNQSEFRKHDALLRDALGNRVPENIILVPSSIVQPCYWVVEAKRSHSQLQVALSEAQEYAALIHATAPDAARFATGIAGSPHDSFYVATRYWDGTKWHDVAINHYETTGFLSPSQCRDILSRNSPNILDYDIDLNAFLRKANDINKTLHKNGVAARDRARLVAGLLLALAQQADLTISDEPRTLVRDVNARIEALLRTHRKVEFFQEVALKLPTTPENHRKYWMAIVQTMQHLREMNIRSAINSGTDALGQFYETFLKYANDASEMGIVLTPRHITKFAVDVLGIRHSDTIFDPTCGTGGFLVAALDSIRERHYGQHRDVYDTFRNDCLYGVEQADDVFALALVNMIFRGDGKSRIHNGNCFDNGWVRADDRISRVGRAKGTGVFTKVLMNPPFAVEEKESEFVDYALGQMAGGGVLFAILPNVPITGHSEAGWRRRMTERHTIRAVVRLRDDLFYPTAHKGTYALIVEAWRPHQADDPVFFGMLPRRPQRQEVQDALSFRCARQRGENDGRLTGVHCWSIYAASRCSGGKYRSPPRNVSGAGFRTRGLCGQRFSDDAQSRMRPQPFPCPSGPEGGPANEPDPRRLGTGIRGPRSASGEAGPVTGSQAHGTRQCPGDHIERPLERHRRILRCLARTHSPQCRHRKCEWQRRKRSGVLATPSLCGQRRHAHLHPPSRL